MDAKVFDWFQLEIDQHLEKINDLVAKHTPENTDANYFNRLDMDLERVIKTLENNNDKPRT